jgi:hypothetical protein
VGTLAASLFRAAGSYTSFEFSPGLLPAPGLAIVARRRLATSEAILQYFMQPRLALLFRAACLQTPGHCLLGLLPAVVLAVRPLALLQAVRKNPVGLGPALFGRAAVFTADLEDMIRMPCTAVFAAVRPRRNIASAQTILQHLSEFALAFFFAAAVGKAAFSGMPGPALAKLRAIGRWRRFFASG